MQKIIHNCLLILISAVLMSSACSDDYKGRENALKQLFEQYREGEISECTHQGKKVFSAGLNAPDAGTEIYDSDGKKIGACYYASRQVDSICEQLENCEVIYRCENHIAGLPATDKYGLAK